jgi:hypothetical protein
MKRKLTKFPFTLYFNPSLINPYSLSQLGIFVFYIMDGLLSAYISHS